jgi:hypothetical protein
MYKQHWRGRNLYTTFSQFVSKFHDSIVHLDGLVFARLVFLYTEVISISMIQCFIVLINFIQVFQFTNFYYSVIVSHLIVQELWLSFDVLFFFEIKLKCFLLLLCAFSNYIQLGSLNVNNIH